MIRYARSLLLALALAFALPGAGHAQLGSMIDFINKLSGPETVGSALKLAVSPDRAVLRERANPSLRGRGGAWAPTAGSLALGLGGRWDLDPPDADALTAQLSWEPRLFLVGSADLGLLAGVGAQRWSGSGFDTFTSWSFPLNLFLDVFLTDPGARIDVALQLAGGPIWFLLPDDAFEPAYPAEDGVERTWGVGVGLKIGRFNLVDALR